MKVIVNDRHLTNIANAIRQLNGRAVSYKAREMSQAIDELPELAVSGHAFRVTINQTPHQTITVQKYLRRNETVSMGSFTVSEPFYYIDISITPDEGYEAGTLNHSGTMVIDRDIIIEATPATPIQQGG